MQKNTELNLHHYFELLDASLTGYHYAESVKGQSLYLINLFVDIRQVLMGMHQVLYTSIVANLVSAIFCFAFPEKNSQV